jgi:hypothetical protein
MRSASRSNQRTSVVIRRATPEDVPVCGTIGYEVKTRSGIYSLRNTTVVGYGSMMNTRSPSDLREPVIVSLRTAGSPAQRRPSTGPDLPDAHPMLRRIAPRRQVGRSATCGARSAPARRGLPSRPDPPLLARRAPLGPGRTPTREGYRRNGTIQEFNCASLLRRRRFPSIARLNERD